MLIQHAVDVHGQEVELYLSGGRIQAVGQGLAALAGPDEPVVDAAGLTVLPAFVDLHVHWRTPGFEYKEDVATGSRAAAAGGYTFVNLMPNTKPVCSSAAQAAAVEDEAPSPKTLTAAPWTTSRPCPKRCGSSPRTAMECRAPASWPGPLPSAIRRASPS